MAEPMHGYGRKPIPHTQLCLSIVHGGQAMYLSICLTTDIIVINKSLLHLFFIHIYLTFSFLQLRNDDLRHTQYPETVGRFGITFD